MQLGWGRARKIVVLAMVVLVVAEVGVGEGWRWGRNEEGMRCVLVCVYGRAGGWVRVGGGGGGGREEVDGCSCLRKGAGGGAHAI